MLLSSRIIMLLGIGFSTLLEAAPASNPALLSSADYSRQTESLVNDYRKKNRLPLLCRDDTLGKASNIHNKEMETLGRSTHDDLEGSADPVLNRLTKLGQDPDYWGENVAEGYVRPESVLDGWLNSPVHLAVIRTPQYNAHGVDKRGDFTTHTFAKIPNKVCTNQGLVDENLAQEIKNQELKDDNPYGDKVKYDEEGNPLLNDDPELIKKVADEKKKLDGDSAFEIPTSSVKVGKMEPPNDKFPEKAKDSEFACCTQCKDISKNESIFNEAENVDVANRY